MRKYYLFILSFLGFFISCITYLQISQIAFAANATSNCTCANPNIAGAGKNGYKCDNGYTSSCSDSSSKNGGSDLDACVSSTGNTVFSEQRRCVHGRLILPNGNNISCTGDPPGTDYKGVTCTNNPNQAKVPTASGSGTVAAVTCQCGDTKGNHKQDVYCYNNTSKPAGVDIHSCGSDPKAKKCVASDNIFTDTKWEQAVRGAACVAQCQCVQNGVAGQNNNNWTCASGSGDGSGACHNLEDKCVNSAIPIPMDTDPFGPTTGNGQDTGDWKSVSCVNSTKCACNGNAIVCTAEGVGPVNMDGKASDENFTYDCGNDQCIVGPKYSIGTKVFGQDVAGIGCVAPVQTPIPPLVSPPCDVWVNGECTQFNSAFGKIQTDPAGFIQTIFGILLSASGGIALLLIIRSGYQLMTSQGNPEQVKNGRDQLIAAIVGLIFLIFSFVFLQLIGFDILRIPGFGGTDTGVTQQSCTAVGEQYCSSIQSCYPVSSTCP